MKKLLLVSIIFLAAGGWWAWNIYLQPPLHKNHEVKPVTATTPPERKILYWYDPMKPDQHFDKPGKSPFMDMDLIPKYEDEQQSNKNVSPHTVRFKQAFNVRLGKFQVDTNKRIWVPNEALLITGNKTFLFVAEGNGYFNPVEVRTGVTTADMTEIIGNVDVQQNLLLSAAFLIDAESNIAGELTYIKGRTNHD